MSLSITEYVITYTDWIIIWERHLKTEMDMRTMETE